MSKFAVKLGVPEHGWIPICMHVGDQLLELDASDVPVDPLLQMIQASRKLMKGVDAEIHIHLEPSGYILTFEHDDEGVSLTVESVDDLHRPKRKETICIVHDKAETFSLPLYRAVSEFYSHKYTEEQWPRMNDSEFSKLKDLVLRAKG